VVNINTFKTALRTGTISKFTKLNKREQFDSAAGVDIDDLTTATTTPTPKAVIYLTQCENASPATMHVTQKAGLSSREQVEAVLATLRPDK
jgi:hypothetical protein